MIKKNDTKELTPLANLQNEIRKIFDFKNQTNLGIGSDELYVGLYFLLLHHERVLSQHRSMAYEELRESLINVSQYFEDDKFVFFELLQSEFSPIIRRLNVSGIYQIIDVLTTQDQVLFTRHFPEIFDDLLIRLLKARRQFRNDSILPYELTNFICGLVELPPKADVYNPFSGYGSFIIGLDQHVYGACQEIDKSTHTVGLMRLIAHERFLNTVFIQDDSIEHWNFEKEKYDLIISNPPFGLKLGDEIHGDWGRIKTVEHFVIERGLKDLKNTGKLIVVISNGFLSRSGVEQNLRTQIIGDDLLEMVIAIPGGVLNNTGIPVTILVFAKEKAEKDIVRFLDAEHFLINPGAREKVLDEVGLSAALKRSTESEYLKLVPNATIQDFDCNLSLPRYFAPNVSIEGNGELIELVDLVSPILVQRAQQSESGKLVTLRNLKESRLDYELDLEKIIGDQVPRTAMRISESCLLIAARGNSINPTVFTYSGTSIFIASDIIALTIKPEKIDLIYLINELHAQYVSEQVKSFRTSSVIPALKKDDLLAIKIKVVDLNEQKAKVKELIEAMAEEKKRELLLFNKIHGLENAIGEQNAYLRHSLAGASSNLKGSLEAIKNIIVKQVVPLVPNVLQLKVGPSHTLDFGKYLDIIERDISKITQTTSRVTSNLDPTAGQELYPLEIYDFIHSYVVEKLGIGKLPYKLEFSWDENVFMDENGGIIRTYILANKELLTNLLDNLIQNAEQHAFPGNPANRIEIYLMIHTENNVNTEVALLVSNTGKSFPEDFDVNDFRKNGRTAGDNSGDGYGGWLIAKIVSYFNGSFDIIDEQGGEGLLGTDLATSFEFNFPITEYQSDETV